MRSKRQAELPYREKHIPHRRNTRQPEGLREGPASAQLLTSAVFTTSLHFFSEWPE